MEVVFGWKGAKIRIVYCNIFVLIFLHSAAVEFMQRGEIELNLCCAGSERGCARRQQGRLRFYENITTIDDSHSEVIIASMSHHWGRSNLQGAVGHLFIQSCLRLR